MWLLIDLEKNLYTVYYSFRRLKRENGISKDFEEPNTPVQIGKKFMILKPHLDERI